LKAKWGKNMVFGPVCRSDSMLNMVFGPVCRSDSMFVTKENPSCKKNPHRVKTRRIQLWQLEALQALRENCILSCKQSFLFESGARFSLKSQNVSRNSEHLKRD
jgi:hypothetical protein